MLTRRAFSMLPAYLGFYLQDSTPSDKNQYLEAKDLLIKGKKLKRSIQLLEKCKYTDGLFLYLCACVGHLASITYAALEWDAYLQEKENLEFKKKKNPDLDISLPPVRTPDDNKDFDLASPAVSEEIFFLISKILTSGTVIDKSLAEIGASKGGEEHLKNLHLYISALVLLNQILQLLPEKFTKNKDLKEFCSASKITELIDSFLELQPSTYSLLSLKAMARTLRLLYLYPHQKLIAFSLGNSEMLGISQKDLTESLSYLDTATSKSPKNREALLYKSLLLSLSDKSKALEQLDAYLRYSPSMAVLHLFKAELLFQTEKGDPFESLRLANGSPIFGDFSFTIPFRFELKACFGYFKWNSGLVLSRSLSALFSHAQSHFSRVKPEEMTGAHLLQIEALFNLGIRAIDSFQKQAPSSYQEIASQRGMILLGIVNVYNAYEIVKKSNMVSYSKEKNDFLEKYAETLEYVKKIDAELTQ